MWPFKKKQSLQKMHTRRFEAAKSSHLFASWARTALSINKDIRQDVESLRSRSRDLSVNDPYFRKHLNLIQENVLGSQGIRLQNRSIQEIKTGGLIVYDEVANRLIEAAWERWGEKGSCTVCGRMSFKQVQKVVVKALVRDGEVFVLKRKGFRGNEFRFALDVLEADYLDIKHNERLANGNRVVMGVELNADNKAVAYHFYKENPNDDAIYRKSKKEKVRIAADAVVHVFEPERAGQVRGFPWSCASMTRSKMLDGYEEAELVAARIAASKMGFFTSPAGDGYVGDAEGVDGNGNTIQLTDADPGGFEQLPEGVSFQSWDPQHPTSSYKDFIKGVLRGIASGLGIGYNTLANDYEGVNYSSLRASNISERDFYKDIQQTIIDCFLKQIFSDWLKMALSFDALPSLPVSKYNKFNAATWRPRGWMWVDPLKEVKANVEAKNNHLKSDSMIATEQGLNVEEIYADLSRERELKKRYGLKEPALKPQGKEIEIDEDDIEA